MEVLKADWLCHLRDTRKGGGPSSIFTISVDASGRRLASAGLDSTIRVWNLDALHQPSQPKLLAAMTRHDGAVLCVKWSPSTCTEDYLASAADDSIVLIWKQDREGPAVGGAFDFDHDKLGLNPPVESYRVAHRLTEHTSDVAGLEWSPDGRWLASCGLDSNILIWDVLAGFKLTVKLEGHKGFVKGLAWDPLGVYLASQSDDHTMIIWRTHDWQYETMLKKPFDQANEETFFRRPSWTPDGKFIAAANAVNGRQPVISLISREEWKPEIAFVGHLLAVEVARFSPYFYRREGSEDVGYLCAAGSQDCNTSIWTDKSSKPLAVLTDLFEHAVMDIEWLADGLSLLIAAYDGTVAKVKLDAALIGSPLIGAEQVAYLASLTKGAGRLGEQLPCTVAQVDLMAQLEALQSSNNTNGSQDVPMQEATPVPQLVVPVPIPSTVLRPVVVEPLAVRQVETKTKEGKRRVAPMLMQSEPSQALSQPAISASTPQAGHTFAPSAPPDVPVLKAPTLQKRLFSETGPSSSVEVTNVKAFGSIQAETKIRFTNSDSLIWEEKLESHVMHLVASVLDGISVAALQNKTLVIFSRLGRRLSPPLIMESQPVFMAARGSVFLVLLANGIFKLWDLLQMSLLKSGSLSLIAQKGSVTDVILLDHGSFRVSFLDGRVFEYVVRMDSFVQTSGGIFRALEYCASSLPSSSDGSLLTEALAMDKVEARSTSIAALESRLSLAALQSDLKSFSLGLATYIRRMVTEGLQDRLLETVTSIAHQGQCGGFPWLSMDRVSLLSSIRPLLAGLPNLDLLLEELDLIFRLGP